MSKGSRTAIGAQLDKIVKTEGIHEQELDKELMLHDSDTDKIHVLNETAKIVWQLADGNHTLEEIETEISENFSLNKNRDIKSDIEKIIRELKKEKLIRTSF